VACPLRSVHPDTRGGERTTTLTLSAAHGSGSCFVAFSLEDKSSQRLRSAASCVCSSCRLLPFASTSLFRWSLTSMAALRASRIWSALQLMFAGD
jgi:hypothetical protein